MQITFIRHLPTSWNNKHQLQGKKDILISPITASAKNEVEKNQMQLNKLAPFDIVLASSLKRTQQTAWIYGFHPEAESLLDELDFGVFEGKPKQQLMSCYGDKWLYTPGDLILGESLTNFASRILLFLEKYKSYQNILVFGHGSWIRACLSLCKHGHINQMNEITVKNNACITISSFSEARQ